MKLRFYNFKLKQDYDRIKILFWGHFFFLILSTIVEIFNGSTGFFIGLFEIFIFSAVYRWFYKTVRELYYTFWIFGCVMAIYMIMGIYDSIFVYGSASLFYSYFLSGALFSALSYVLSSPIYFPRARWWEYDFRYRYDLKVKVWHGENELEGRMSDLRRGAGCIIMFDLFDAGDIISIKVDDQYKEFNLNAEIVSKREYSFGRGYSYGIKFNFDTLEHKKEFSVFCKFWKKEMNSKIKNKFRETRESQNSKVVA